jgi:hypothetical protein
VLALGSCSRRAINLRGVTSDDEQLRSVLTAVAWFDLRIYSAVGRGHRSNLHGGCLGFAVQRKRVGLGACFHLPPPVWQRFASSEAPAVQPTNAASLSSLSVCVPWDPGGTHGELPHSCGWGSSVVSPSAAQEWGSSVVSPSAASLNLLHLTFYVMFKHNVKGQQAKRCIKIIRAHNCLNNLNPEGVSMYFKGNKQSPA